MLYNAYNGITPARTGVSPGDFKEADAIMKKVG